MKDVNRLIKRLKDTEMRLRPTKKRVKQCHHAKVKPNKVEHHAGTSQYQGVEGHCRLCSLGQHYWYFQFRELDSNRWQAQRVRVNSQRSTPASTKFHHRILFVERKSYRELH